MLSPAGQLHHTPEEVAKNQNGKLSATIQNERNIGQDRQ